MTIRIGGVSDLNRYHAEHYERQKILVDEALADPERIKTALAILDEEQRSGVLLRMRSTFESALLGTPARKPPPPAPQFDYPAEVPIAVAELALRDEPGGPPMTPETLVESHPVTQELIALGVTAEQLSSIRFSSRNEGVPFEYWSVRAAHNTPQAAMPLLKSYATLWWLIIKNPPHSRDKRDAWNYLKDERVSRELQHTQAQARVARAALQAAEPDIVLAKSHRASQAKRASRPRVKIGEDGETIVGVVSLIANDPEHRDLSAAGLWHHFYGKLDELGLGPREVIVGRVKAYRYTVAEGKVRQMTFTRFRKIVHTARKTTVN